MPAKKIHMRFRMMRNGQVSLRLLDPQKGPTTRTNTHWWYTTPGALRGEVRAVHRPQVWARKLRHIRMANEILSPGPHRNVHRCRDERSVTVLSLPHAHTSKLGDGNIRGVLARCRPFYPVLLSRGLLVW